MLITTNRNFNYAGFDRKRSDKQCIIIGWGKPQEPKISSGYERS